MEIGHGQKREREWATVAWLSPGLGWGIYMASLRRGATVYATQRRSEREKKKKKRFEVQCCWRQTARCCMRKGSPVIKGEAKNVWYLNVRQRAQSQKGVAGVGVRWQRCRVGASETNEGSKTMRGIRRHMKMERIWPKPGRPKSNKART